MTNINSLTKEDLIKDNKNMFKKYQENFTNYNVSNEIAKQLKKDLKKIENKYNDLEKVKNELENENKKWESKNKEWTAKDEEMTKYLNDNGFKGPKDLSIFIEKFKNHKCICNCPPIEENDKYKEKIMEIDILNFNRKRQLELQILNDKLRCNLDDNKKKYEKEIDIIKNQLLEKDNKIQNDFEKINDNIENNENIKIKELVNENINDNLEKDKNTNKLNITDLNKINTDEKISETFISTTINKNNKKDDQNNNKITKIEKKDKYINKNNNYRCTIVRFKDLNEKSKKSHIKAARETTHEIIHYYELYKDVIDDKKTIDDIVTYILKSKNQKDKAGNNRQNCKNKIKRCYDIYLQYGEDLKDLYFNLTAMSRIYGDNWNMWLEYLDNFINGNENDEKINTISINNLNNNDIKENINKKYNSNIINFKDVKKNLDKIDNNKKPCGNVNYKCSEYVTNRKYCQECIADGYYTDMSDSENEDDY